MIGQGYKLSNQEEKLSSIGGSPIGSHYYLMWIIRFHIIVNPPYEFLTATKLQRIHYCVVTARKD